MIVVLFIPLLLFSSLANQSTYISSPSHSGSGLPSVSSSSASFNLCSSLSDGGGSVTSTSYQADLTIGGINGVSSSTSYQASLYTSPCLHEALPDVALGSIALSRTDAYEGVASTPVTVTVKAANYGLVPETFTLTIAANGTTIDSQLVSVNPGGGAIASYNWTTSALTRGNYLVSAHASTVQGESNLANNDIASSNIFTVKKKGDVNNDCIINIIDLATVGANFGKPGFNPAADLNNDGVVNIVDLVLVAGNFGQKC